MASAEAPVELKDARAAAQTLTQEHRALADAEALAAAPAELQAAAVLLNKQDSIFYFLDFYIGCLHNLYI